jgi:hypothetical protein
MAEQVILYCEVEVENVSFFVKLGIKLIALL